MQPTQPFTATFDWRASELTLRLSGALSKLKMPSGRLVEAVLDLARQRIELIQLNVVQDNEQARRLYASQGFLDYGLEKNALKQNGRYYDEVLMAKNLLGN